MYLFIYLLFMLLSVLLKLTYAFVYIAMFISYCVYIECRGRVETSVVRTFDPTPLLYILFLVYNQVCRLSHDTHVISHSCTCTTFDYPFELVRKNGFPILNLLTKSA